MNGRTTQTKKLVMGAILTALVILLQMMGSFIRLGPFSISLVLLPIVIGAATCGIGIATWLGFVFGAVVLISGDAAAFLAVDPLGTVITVMVKGTLAGLVAGLLYEEISPTNRYLAVVVAAIACPLVNTGVFLLGCRVFFMETVTIWAEQAGLGGNVAHYMIFFLVGGNFLFEILSNMILSPVIVRLLKVRDY